jgi:hypothetical protein
MGREGRMKDGRRGKKEDWDMRKNGGWEESEYWD